MAERWTGGCQCGTVRYLFEGEPEALICCHCTECQQQAASAFGMSLYVPAEGFRVTQGETRTWQRPTDSGKTIDCHFCPKCGTRLYHQTVEKPERVSIKAGSLDDRKDLQPAGYLWTRSAQSWIQLPEDALAYEGQPPDFETIKARWRATRRAV